jgi:hypothetical protein
MTKPGASTPSSVSLEEWKGELVTNASTHTGTYHRGTHKYTQAHTEEHTQEHTTEAYTRTHLNTHHRCIHRHTLTRAYYLPLCNCLEVGGEERRKWRKMLRTWMEEQHGPLLVILAKSSPNPTKTGRERQA